MTRFVVLLVSMVVPVICTAEDISGKHLDDFYLVESPDQRLNNYQKYFSHEYEQINFRRERKDSDIRPEFLTGLALSGGGIRSSAYQLGILSGLYRSAERLKKVDYISSVSGGSWVNGAYWAWSSFEKDFFNCLGKSYLSH